MRAHIISEGKVVNTIEVDSLDFMPNLVDGTVGGIGWDYVGGVLSAPYVAPVEVDYRTQRAIKYPPIGDQLDALWKGGDAAAEMLAQVQAVKAQYPKPE